MLPTIAHTMAPAKSSCPVLVLTAPQRLAYVHDYVHFIVDSHKRATKARMIPTRISLPYFTHTINSGRTSATTATSAGKPFSQGQDPRSHSSTATIEQGTDSHGSGTDGSAAAVTGQADSVAVTELRLSVMTGKVRACQDFGLPASCCVLTCTLDEVSAPVTVLTVRFLVCIHMSSHAVMSL